MRAIPHRVIVLMGLDINIYPRRKFRPSFNLLEQKNQLGDPHSSDQDRYVILEALMSSRKHLLVTWNCRNERTGEEIPPASPIQQFCSYLKNELDSKDFAGLFINPPANPLDQRNFISNNNNHPISCDRRDLEARLWLNKQLKPKRVALALPMKWRTPNQSTNTNISNELLKAWLIGPQLTWLEQLEINPRERVNLVQDLDSFNLNNLEKYNLLKQRLDSFIEQIPSSSNKSLKITSQEHWTKILAGQGVLPPKAAANLEVEALERSWHHLQSTLKELGPCSKRLLELSDTSLNVLWAGNFAVIVEIGKLKPKAVMQGWLTHLHLCANGGGHTETIVIARHSSRTKSEQFEIAIRFKPMHIPQAKKILQNLTLLAKQGLQMCWPIPPESGWAYAQTTFKNPEKRVQAFRSKWNSGLSSPGEREKAEMLVCFGKHYEVSDFLESERFQDAFKSLYGPLIETISK